MYRYIILFLLINITSVQAFEKRALVFGNGDYYGKWALTNPANDAEDVAAALRDLDFKVTLLVNQNNRGMSDAVQHFTRELENGDVALFYFSGHGFSGRNVNNMETNFLVGRFNQIIFTKAALEEESIDANFVVKSLRQSNPQGINIMVLDACRDVPPDFLEEQKGLFDEGLVSLGKYERFIVNYATQPLKRALGSKNNRNSLYTQYLLEGLKNSQLTTKNVTEFFNEVGLEMVDDLGDKQVPLVEAPPVRFCLAGCMDSTDRKGKLEDLLSITNHTTTASTNKEEKLEVSSPTTSHTTVASASHKECYVADPYVNITYIGECKNKMANGNGKAIGRDIYEGEFKNGQFDGEGTYTWEDGDKFIGEFKEGVFHGHGIMVYTTGERLEGIWENGQRIK